MWGGLGFLGWGVYRILWIKVGPCALVGPWVPGSRPNAVTGRWGGLGWGFWVGGCIECCELFVNIWGSGVPAGCLLFNIVWRLGF